MKDDGITYKTHYFQKTVDTSAYSGFVLGADIGGTSTNVAVAGITDDTIDLLFSLDFETKKISSFLPALKKTIAFARNKYDICILNGCVGAAGIVSSDHSFVELTNVSWNINAKELIKETAMDSLFILNDFQVLGYGINTIDLSDEKDVSIIRKNVSIDTKEPRVLLGAGTGLGKTILRYDQKNRFFHAFESEGGHADIPVYTRTEFDLIKTIQQRKHSHYPVSYEDLLSGEGIVDIYSFLRSKQLFKDSEYSELIDTAEDKPAIISNYRSKDEYCTETFRLFQRFFARCAKNLGLDTLAKGGVFIAGGIAEKNKDIFLSNQFIDEFNRSHTREKYLKEIPLYLLTNYYLSLQGACFAAFHAPTILNHQKNVKRRGEGRL
ncbi:MAG: glucokinase [Candidatus Thermoplasmatota archaeon]|nr:glucokinase [Candidatus Thermoplasmatota archaeon]